MYIAIQSEDFTSHSIYTSVIQDVCSVHHHFDDELFLFIGTMDQKIHVTQQQRHASLPYVKTKKVFTCSLEFERLALRLMVQNNLRNPRSVLESRKLYDDLLSLIQQI